MALTIETPTEVPALTEFLTFHDEVYAARGARWTALVPFQLPILTGESPFNEERTVRPFVAREGGRIVARVLAVIDRRYQRHWQESLGHLTMFEALPGTRVPVRTVMDAACAWLEEHGATAARAGMGLLEFPFATDAYDTLPPAFLRQNPEYYQCLLKDAGFESEQGMVDYHLTVRPELVARWEAAVAAAARNGFRFVPLAELPPEKRIGEFTALWNETFTSHFGYTPFSDAEMALIQEAMTPVGMLETSLLVYRGEEAVGALWLMPDTSYLAALAPGRELRAAERLNFLGLGVRKNARGQGVNLAMPAHAYLELVRRGATHLSYTLVLDDNWPSRRTAEKLGAEVCANYLVYRRNFRR